MLTWPSPLPSSFSMSAANAWPEKLSATVNAVQDFRKDFMVILPLAGTALDGGMTQEGKVSRILRVSQIHLSEMRYRIFR